MYNRFRIRQLLSAAKKLALGLTAASSVCFAIPNVYAKPLKLEKEELKSGFIKLTDMAPLAIAYEKGFFEDEGLFVTLEAQANWKVLLDRVIDGDRRIGPVDVLATGS
jgi:nitrate/nitrite transport system substrate-binding protein